MSLFPEKTDVSCASGCGGCGRDGLPAHTPHEGLSGWRLTVSAIAVFLMPLLLAVAGTIVAGRGDLRKFLGAMTGLLAGLAGGVVISRLVARSGKGRP